jgi:hypothetical protein
MPACTQPVIARVGAPGVKMPATPRSSSSGMPSAGMIPPPNTTMSSAPSAEHHDVLGALLPEQPQHLGEERHAGPGEHR